MNFLSATLAILGVVTSLTIGPSVAEYTVFMLPFAAGRFIYIVGSDLIPVLHCERGIPRSIMQLAMLCSGVGMMFFLLILE